MPNGATRSISVDSHTAPPWGASASPQTVTISDDALGLASVSRRRIQRLTCGSGPGQGWEAVSDTVIM